MSEFDNDTLQQMVEQICHLQQELTILRTEVTHLRATEIRTEAKAGRTIEQTSVPARTTSRRQLLTGVGAATAAATVALVVSEQTAHADPATPANDGSTLVLGSANFATSETLLTTTGSSSANPFFYVEPVYPSGTTFGTAFEADSNATSGIGVVGSGTTGVKGNGGGIGVFGSSGSGIGVQGQSTSGIDLAANGTGRLLQKPQGSAGAPTSGTYTAGEQIRDSPGNLYICTAGSSPGTWRQAFTTGSIVTASSQTELQAASGSNPVTLLVVDSSPAGGNQNGITSTATGTGTGVQGISSSGTGVNGSSSGASINSYGVQGSSSGGPGVYGNSGSGIGVLASSTTGIDLCVGRVLGGVNVGQGRLFQLLQSFAGAPTSGTYGKGEQIRDINGDLWICVAGGTPGQWVRAAHAVYGYIGGATSYLSKPIRLLDTRGSDPNAQHNGGGPYTSTGSPYALQIAGVNWQSVQVPAGSVGAIGKVTAVSTTAGGGFIALVPSGSGSPTTGTLPYGASQTVATSFNVGLGGNPGAIDIYIGGNPTDVVIDLFAVVA